MSVLNQSGEEQVECPLCMEPLEVDDLHFYPCTCGYQICRFCWNRIREGENGLCPACRKAYPENPADFTPLSQEQVAAIKTEKRAREAKRRNKTLESRRALANVRVVQNNLVFVVGLPVRLADPEILKRQEYFGKYGKIHKVVINQSTTYAGSQGPSASAYVTYVSPADALRAIQGVNNVTLDGRVLKGSLGTTKYCANFMKNQPCPKPDCMYLHELGDPKASFTKEEMHAGLHQVYERKLHNQLLQQQRDRPVDEKQSSNTGNSSTIAEKGSQKDGNQSNFIPTTVVTSSHINNVVNSSKSKKESVNGNSGNSNGNSSSSSSNGKEAWPSLGSSPPSDSPARKQPSPKPTVKSQENGTSESSSPTQQSQQQQAQMKNSKDINHTENGSKSNRSNRDASITNGQTSKRNKTDKSKQKNGNSINNSHNNNSNDISEMEDSKQISDSAQNMITDNHTYEHDTQHELQQNQQQQQQQQSFLSSELDELESDRHSLLESRSPSLGERGLLDDEPHALLDGLEARLRSRPTLNGYTLPDREITYAPRLDLTPLDRKELLLREQRRNEMIIRQNELLARHHAQSVLVDPKHYMPTSNIGLDSTSELLGANFHSNPNMLPPFGMRIDNSMATNPLGANSLSANALTANSLTANSMSASGLSGNPLGGAGLATGYLPHPQQILQNQQQIPQTGLVNGFDAQPNANEGRYLAENMEKFFTDFHKTQQMRLLLSRGTGGTEERRYAEPQALHYPHNMLSAERLEMEHKQRMNSMLVKDMGSGRASGDRDDDLDFDPIKETQKAFTEMMETEMMQNTVSSGDSMDRSRRCRLPPPGFGHMNAVNAYGGLGVSRPQIHHQGISSYNSSNAIFSDWTQMDPAIVSTSVNFGKGAPQPQPATTLSQQQRELFARFNHLSVQQPNGVSKLHAPGQHAWPTSAAGAAGPHKWGAAAYANIPLPPGFAPAKPPQHPAECIDAK